MVALCYQIQFLWWNMCSVLHLLQLGPSYNAFLSKGHCYDLGTDHLTCRGGGGMVICCTKCEIFSQNLMLSLGYMTKTLNHIFFFLHQNQKKISSNIGNQNIFLEKKP